MTYTEPRTVALSLRTADFKGTAEALGYSDVVEQVIRASWALDRVALEATIVERDLLREEAHPGIFSTAPRLRGALAALRAIYAGAAA